MISLLPSRFLGCLPLLTGAELIAIFGIINNASGIYGVLSFVSGGHVTAPQLVLNLVALICLPLFVLGYRAIRRRQYMGSALFALLYFLETLTNLAFTIFFCVSWFRSIKKIKKKTPNSVRSIMIGGATDLAISTIELFSRESSKSKNKNKLSSESLSKKAENGLSITITVILLLTKLYFCLILFAFAKKTAHRKERSYDKNLNTFASLDDKGAKKQNV